MKTFNGYKWRQGYRQTFTYQHRQLGKAWRSLILTVAQEIGVTKLVKFLSRFMS